MQQANTYIHTERPRRRQREHTHIYIGNSNAFRNAFEIKRTGWKNNSELVGCMIELMIHYADYAFRRIHIRRQRQRRRQL